MTAPRIGREPGNRHLLDTSAAPFLRAWDSAEAPVGYQHVHNDDDGGGGRSGGGREASHRCVELKHEYPAV